MTLCFTRTRGLFKMQHSWCSLWCGRTCHCTFHSPSPDQRCIISVPQHYWSPKIITRGTPYRAEPNGGQRYFMCKNRWCSEKPKKTTPKLTTLLSVDHTEVHTICSDYNSKQTKRGFSTVAAVNQKLPTLLFFGFLENCRFFTFWRVAAERRALPPFHARGDLIWHVLDLGFKYERN